MADNEFRKFPFSTPGLGEIRRDRLWPMYGLVNPRHHDLIHNVTRPELVSYLRVFLHFFSRNRLPLHILCETLHKLWGADKKLKQLTKSLDKVNTAAGSREVLHRSLTKDTMHGVAEFVKQRCHLMGVHPSGLPVAGTIGITLG
eukprot:CAMPEP_0201485704 /NCGR_PEP_ID=MMETSP0151_2-20130828/9806_1 /ASSEMBLY_ACC=CAM_ASM_000257 /TAXON_ID=200890 /ORGANISM="Paramoeba atlantica, Strain 621/1 / CCAP 1560/9" /LENGTH=143 /DNA_ID=CAMNT_0047869955 /DNA_START=279 /DNA_END=710 /DNA_ORIENTATION=-